LLLRHEALSPHFDYYKAEADIPLTGSRLLCPKASIGSTREMMTQLIMLIDDAGIGGPEARLAILRIRGAELTIR
jgi:hypothetical protein